MFENVRGLLEAIFADYRNFISGELSKLGYWTDWKLLNASDYGVPQLRPRVVFVAIKSESAGFYSWPVPTSAEPKTVGEILYDLMTVSGWLGAKEWRTRANDIAPLL